MSFRSMVVREAHIFLFALTLRFIIMEVRVIRQFKVVLFRAPCANCIEWQERIVFNSIRNWKVNFGSLSNILPFNIVPFCQAYGRYSWLKQKGTIKFILFLMQWLVLKPIVLIKGQLWKKHIIISGLQLLTDISLRISMGEARFNLRQQKAKRESYPFIVTFVIDIAPTETFRGRVVQARIFISCWVPDKGIHTEVSPFSHILPSISELILCYTKDFMGGSQFGIKNP